MHPAVGHLDQLEQAGVVVGPQLQARGAQHQVAQWPVLGTGHGTSVSNHVRDHSAGAGWAGGAGVGRGAGPGGRARRGRAGRGGQRGQPGRPAATPGPLPAAARRVGDHRAGVLGADRRARRGRHRLVGRRRGVRAAGRRRVRREGRGAGRAAAADPVRRGPGDGRRAARGGLHGLVEHRRRRPAVGRRDVPDPGRQQRHRQPRHPGGQGARRPVAATAGAPDRLQRCRDLGADIVIDYHDDVPAALKEATGGHGADVILDNMGAKGLAANVEALAPDGRLLVIGMQGGTKAELDLNKLLRKRASITAMSLRGRPVEGPNGKGRVVTGVREQVWPMLADGRVRPIVHGTVPDGQGRRGPPPARGGRRRRQDRAGHPPTGYAPRSARGCGQRARRARQVSSARAETRAPVSARVV